MATTQFYEERKEAFLAMVETFPDVVKYKNLQLTCISTSKEVVSEMERTSLIPKKPATFSILREDFLVWQKAGLKPRETVTSDGKSFEVYAIVDDPADATVDLRAIYKL